MPTWPVSPIASMTVTRVVGQDPPYVTSIIPSSANTQQTVLSSDIEFTIKLQYLDPNGLGGQGAFIATLYQKTSSGWVSIDLQTKLLGGNYGQPSNVSDTLTLSAVMSDNVEQYRVALTCSGEDGEATNELSPPIVLQASKSSYFGRFALAFVPISVIYCPPGQDMTNSLTQSRTFGTRFSLGPASHLGWELSNVQSGYVNTSAGEANVSDEDRSAQTADNQTTDTIEISNTSNTVITADNQKAIGRAYWGPLGDQFVILANLQFVLSKMSSGQVLYAPTLDSGEQVLVIPAWKLLRPGSDSVAAAIPADARRSILELDPFITNLDKFFPDSGADLSEAANPYADPTPNNRAELIGRWWLDTGTEIQYSRGTTYQQSFVETNQLSTESSVNHQEGAHTTISDWGIDYQESSETDSSTITNASCFIIKNQNDTDLDGIAIFYDKIFSTFMFQRLRNLSIPQRPWVHPHPPKGKFFKAPYSAPKPTYGLSSGYGVLVGSVSDVDSKPLRGMQIMLTDSTGQKLVVSSNRDGRFVFHNVSVGQYRLTAGDASINAKIAEKASPLQPQRANLTHVRRLINFRKSPLWEIADVLKIPVPKIRRMGKQLYRVTSDQMLMKVTGTSAATLRNWKARAVFPWTIPAQDQRKGKERRSVRSKK